MPFPFVYVAVSHRRAAVLRGTNGERSVTKSKEPRRVSPLRGGILRSSFATLTVRAAKHGGMPVRDGRTAAQGDTILGVFGVGHSPVEGISRLYGFGFILLANPLRYTNV